MLRTRLCASSCSPCTASTPKWDEHRFHLVLGRLYCANPASVMRSRSAQSCLYLATQSSVFFPLALYTAMKKQTWIIHSVTASTTKLAVPSESLGIHLFGCNSSCDLVPREPGHRLYQWITCAELLYCSVQYDPSSMMQLVSPGC